LAGVLSAICLWAPAGATAEPYQPDRPNTEQPPPHPAGDAAAATAGYKPDEGFYLSSPDGNYVLRPGLNAAYRLEPRFLNGVSQDRDAIFAVRPRLAGNVFRPWITFLTVVELAQNPPFLFMSWIDVRPRREIGLRVGQQDTPFSRHETFGIFRTLFPDMDPVAEYFWTGRDKGITLLGTLGDELVDYWAGVYAGSPVGQFATIAGNYVLEARATINPHGAVGVTEYPYMLREPAPLRLSFTAQGYFGNVQSATQSFNQSSFTFTAMPTGMTTRQAAGGLDVFLQGPRFVLFSEAYLRRTEPPAAASYTGIGAWGELGVRLVERLDAAIRLSWANPSVELPEDRFLAAEAQVAWYVTIPSLILKLRYGIGDQQTPGMAALGAVTLPATAGRTQLLTLQINLVI
jgi:hypothetical protein